MVGSKERNLFKENVVLFGEQMDPLSTVTRVLTAILAPITDAYICRLFSSELLQGGGVGPSFLDEAKVLSLFDLEAGDESLIVGHQLAMDLGLLTNCRLQGSDVLRERSDMLFVLLDEWSDGVTTEELCETVIGHISRINIVRVGCLQNPILQWLVQNLVDLGLFRGQKRLIRTELFLVVFELAAEALDDLLE